MKKLSWLSFLLLTLLFTSCKIQELTFVGIDNIKINSFSQKGVEAEIVATINNPNRASFTIYKSAMDVSVSGLNAGKAELANKIKIKGKSQQSYTFKVKADFSKLTTADMPKLLGLAFSNNLNISLKGNLNVGKMFVRRSIPVNVNKTVPLN